MSRVDQSLLRESEMTVAALQGARDDHEPIDALFFRFSLESGSLHIMVPTPNRSIEDLVGDLIKAGIDPANIWPVSIAVGGIIGVTAKVWVPPTKVPS